MNRRVQLLAVATAIGMFLVVMGGALVTYTNAGQGCGHDWPLCNGKFVPAYSLQSMIEYSHRAVTGIVSVLVLLTSLGVWTRYRSRADVQIYAGIMVLFTLVQAAMGALAVIWPQSSAVMALHLGFSLLAFSGSIMLALALLNPAPSGLPLSADGWRSKRQGAVPGLATIGKAYRNLVWGATLYCYAVVYVGAYVSHTTSGGGCIGWPLCNGKWVPKLEGATRIVFEHRIAALILVLLIAGLTVRAYTRYRGWKELRVTTAWIAALVLIQALSGAWVTLAIGHDEAFIFAILVHTVTVTCLFGLLCYLSVRIWQLQRAS